MVMTQMTEQAGLPMNRIKTTPLVARAVRCCHVPVVFLAESSGVRRQLQVRALTRRHAVVEVLFDGLVRGVFSAAFVPW
jgi:hypothetical protein